MDHGGVTLSSAFGRSGTGTIRLGLRRHHPSPPEGLETPLFDAAARVRSSKRRS
jgi:hypothetical protein